MEMSDWSSDVCSSDLRPRKSFDARSFSMVCRKCSSGFETSLASPHHSGCKLQQTGFTQTFFANLLMGGCLQSNTRESICTTVSMLRRSEWSDLCGLPGAVADVCSRCRPRATFQALPGPFNLCRNSHSTKLTDLFPYSSGREPSIVRRTKVFDSLYFS